MMRLRTIWLLLFFITVIASAQNPQTQTAPIYAVNAKYTNGVAPGYAPTAGTGLNLALGPGTANCSGTIETYSGGTLALTSSTTNYVYLNTSASCAPAVKTSAFGATDIPVATVVAGGSSITSIVDDRTFFNTPGGSTSPSSPLFSLQFDNSGAFGGANADWNATTTNGFDFGMVQAANVTAFSCNGTDCTLTAANTFLAGEFIVTGTGYANSCMNDSVATAVLSTGLTSSQFEIAQSATTCSGTVSGSQATAGVTSAPVGFTVNGNPATGINLITSGTPLSGQFGQINISTMLNGSGGFDSGNINISTGQQTGFSQGSDINLSTNVGGILSGDITFTTQGTSGGGLNFGFSASMTGGSSNSNSAQFNVNLASTNTALGSGDANTNWDESAEDGGANFSITLNNAVHPPLGGNSGSFIVEAEGVGGSAGNILLSADNSTSSGDGSFQLTTTGPISWSGSNTSMSIAGALSLGSYIQMPQVTPSDTQACTAGTLWSDANYLYACTATNTVKRAELTTF
jgi:hypothetical protein